jgi:hypothetical protein
MDSNIVSGEFINKTYKNLIHFSESKLFIYPKKEYTQYVCPKPMGLWFSDQDAEYNWYTWCEKEDYCLSGLKHKAKIYFKNHSKCLLLKTSDDIKNFTLSFGKNVFNIDFDDGMETYIFYTHIDWEMVMQLCDVIFITPYIWEQRYVGWYYGWDCASGCIMNLKALNYYIVK